MESNKKTTHAHRAVRGNEWLVSIFDTTMPSHDEKQCPRCNNLFECKSGSVLLCQCQTVTLTEKQLEYIASRYQDCLCAKCLMDIRVEYNHCT